MPIYFGKPVSPKLSNVLAPAKESELKSIDPGSARVTLHTERYNLIGDEAYAHWPELLTASIEKKPVLLNIPVPVYETIKSTPLSLTLPSLCVRFENGIPNNHLSTLNGIGYQKENIYNKEYLIFENPTVDQVQAIASAQPHFDNLCTANTTNLNGMRMAMYMQRVLGGLLKVAGNIIPFTQHSLACPSTIFPIAANSIKEVASSEPGPTQGSKFMIKTGDVTMWKKDPKGQEDMKDYMDTSDSFTTLHCGVVGLGYQFNINTKKLSPIVDVPGFTLPFDRDFAEPDYQLVPRFFAEHALLLLGIDRNSQVERANAIGAAWGVLNKTSWGLQIAHLVTCLRLAINTQSNLVTKITCGRYIGCIIQGYKLAGGVYGTYVNAVPFTSLCHEQLILDRQTLHLKKIIEITGADDYDNLVDPTGDERFESITSYRALQEFVQRYKDNVAQGQEAEIIELAKGLEFPQRPFGHTYNFVEKVLTWCKNSISIPTSVFLNPNYLFSTDRIELSFAAFGPRAPSFQIPGGVKVTLSTSQSYPTHKVKGKNSVTTNVSRPNFVSRPVPIETAILDFKKLIQAKEIENFPAARSTGYTKYNATERPAVWRLLQELATSTSSPFSNISSGNTASSTNPSYFSFGLDF